MGTIRRESDLSAPVCVWLESRGLMAYCEVPIVGSCVDIVGVGELLVAVELKCSLTRHLLKQAALNQNFADESWCAVPTRPRSLEWPKKLGLGVLRVAAEVEVLLEPAHDGDQRHRPFPKRQQQVREFLSRAEPGGVGGRPNPINDGPAQEVARAVAPLYRAGMSWREIFKRVPNHYAHWRSMQSVMLRYPPARAILDRAKRGETACERGKVGT